jgi:Fic family protein
MTNGGENRRDSRAQDPELIKDPHERAEAEVRNGFRQYDAGVALAQEAIDRGAFKLRPSTILSLHREALRGISNYAGNWRPGPVEISKSKHVPPPAHLVPELVEEMCDYVNDSWETSSHIHLAAYVMWRLNWIHPFADGNGRTSRIASYLVLLAKTGTILPGKPTIPDQIQADRSGYFAALDAADEAWQAGRLDVHQMEDLLSGMLAKQLVSYYVEAGGASPLNGLSLPLDQ